MKNLIFHLNKIDLEFLKLGKNLIFLKMAKTIKKKIVETIQGSLKIFSYILDDEIDFTVGFVS